MTYASSEHSSRPSVQTSSIALRIGQTFHRIWFTQSELIRRAIDLYIGRKNLKLVNWKVLENKKPHKKGKDCPGWGRNMNSLFKSLYWYNYQLFYFNSRALLTWVKLFFELKPSALMLIRYIPLGRFSAFQVVS